MKRVVVGIDEVGRGPLAGPVTVCACAVFDLEKILVDAPAPLRDSKQLTKLQRESWVAHIKKCKNNGLCTFTVASVSATNIDNHGIVPCIKSALKKSLESLAVDPAQVDVMLDGGLSAPVEYISQQTIIRGDAQIPEIALASIIAKVHRDTYMYQMAEKYPEYGFDTHVGYGTKKHRQAITDHGTTPIHRVSFLKNLI